MEQINKEFEEYCIIEDYDKIQEFLNLYNWLALSKDYFEIVINKGNLKLIQLFIKYGANVNYISHMSSFYQHDECLLYLLENGAKIKNKECLYGFSHRQQ
jgi:hypothetical protein